MCTALSTRDLWYKHKQTAPSPEGDHLTNAGSTPAGLDPVEKNNIIWMLTDSLKKKTTDCFVWSMASRESKFT